MGSAPISTDKSPEQMALQITSFIVHILIALAVYLGIFLVLTVINPTEIPAIFVTLLVFVLPLAVAYFIHTSGRRTAAPAIWIAGVVWMLMVMVYVLELPTGPGRTQPRIRNWSPAPARNCGNRRARDGPAWVRFVPHCGGMAARCMVHSRILTTTLFRARN